jgi:hypothetical protein
LTGRESEARAAVTDLRRLTVGRWLQDGGGWSDNAVFLAQFARMTDGLRKAGLPE